MCESEQDWERETERARQKENEKRGSAPGDPQGKVKMIAWVLALQMLTQTTLSILWQEQCTIAHPSMHLR